ncbi:MAG: ATP-binding cassette domain-containing protein, partial [Pseudomonadales bacterium]
MQLVTDLLQQMQLGYLQDRVTHKLSGGEKRLVALASVLAMEPEVLLLDEPTNALDEANEALLIDILQQLPQAMVLVSHDPHFRRKIGNRTLRLSEGKLTEPNAACRHAVAS